MAEKTDNPSEHASGDEVKTSGWQEKETKARWREFPGPRSVNEPLRVAMYKNAYADLTAHAKESLDAEICGVLIGDLCEDDAGPFIQVAAIIRGTAAKKGAAHVTFTQETWNQIHKVKERDHAKRQIVGWYHTHPGFGVEFSEMDKFIQKNFFSGASQIAFVTDPLGGKEAILANTASGMVPVSRFWVDSRERRCQVAGDPDDRFAGDGQGVPASVEKAIKSLEDRLTQALQAADQAQTFSHRVLLTIFMLVAFAVLLYIGQTVRQMVWGDPPKPPDLQTWVPVPVQVGDKSVLLGVAVAKWEVPKELNSILLQIEREKQKAEEAARKAEEEAKKKAGGEASPAAPTTPTTPTTAPAGGGKP